MSWGCLCVFNWPASMGDVAEGGGMRCIVCREFGPPGRLVLEQAPDPEPGPGEVLIGVRAAGVSFVDGLIIAGL